MKRKQDSDPDGICRRNEIIKDIYEKRGFYLKTVAASRCSSSFYEDYVQSFFYKRLCRMGIPELVDLRDNKSVGYIRKMLINFIIDENRSSSRKPLSNVSGDIFPPSVGGAVDSILISKEEASKARSMVKAKFSKTRDYLVVFDMMIKHYTDKEIEEATGITSVHSIRHRIRKYLSKKWKD